MLPSASAPDPLERTSAPALAAHLDGLDYLSGRQFAAHATNTTPLAGAQSIIMDERNRQSLGHGDEGSVTL